VRQALENRLVYVILAEDRLVLPEAQAPQPDRNVHFGAPNSGLQHIIVRSGQSVQEVPDGWFSVSIGVSVKTVPRSRATYRVPIRPMTVSFLWAPAYVLRPVERP
jgi:hypothetical protein